MRTSKYAGAIGIIGCMAWTACAQSSEQPGRDASLAVDDSKSSECRSRVWTGDYAVQSQAELDALASYTMVTGSVTISESDLASVDGPACLEFIGGTLSITGNPHLARVSGFGGLRTVGGLHFARNGNWHSGGALRLSGFESLRTITGNVIFQHDHVIHGLAALERIGGDFRLREGSLHVHGMNELRIVGGMGFAEVGIVNLDGLHGLETVIGSIRFVEAGPDVYTAGLRSLTTVGGAIRFSTMTLNDDTLAGFANLDTVGGVLAMVYTGGPEELDGFDSLQALGGISLYETLGPGRITGFAALRSLGGLAVRYSGELTEIAGFAALERITRSLSVQDNRSLRRVSLDGLESIAENLAIGRNQVLDELRLPELESVGGEVAIIGNPDLPTCQAEAIVAELRAHGYTGAATVAGNGSGGCVEQTEQTEQTEQNR